MTTSNTASLEELENNQRIRLNVFTEMLTGVAPETSAAISALYELLQAENRLLLARGVAASSNG